MLSEQLFEFIHQSLRYEYRELQSIADSFYQIFFVNQFLFMK